MACLTAEQIELLGRDALEASEADELRRHVEQCDVCRGKLEECVANEEVLDRLKRWPTPGTLESGGASPALAQTVGFRGESSVVPGSSFPDLAGPDAFTGYTIIREIHRGGQGVVYQAIQKSTKMKVAIKIMKEGPFAGPRARARFKREVEILAQLKHPNVVAVHDSGSTTGGFYYVMDYIAGQPLDVFMADRKYSIQEALRLFTRICQAVNAAHLRGVIHRDLKPSNILVEADGTPRLVDFGLAKIAAGQVSDGPEPQVMTVTGQFIGSLPWASPEQAEGTPEEIDIRTDVYSLGVVLYQMLTGSFPYKVVGHMREVLDHILNAEPSRPSTLRRKIDNEVETIVLKCLSKDRDRRYQSAGDIERDIRRYLTGDPIDAKRDSAWYVIRKLAARHRLPATALGCVLVAILSFGVISMYFYSQAQAALNEKKEKESIAADAMALLAETGEATRPFFRRMTLRWFFLAWESGCTQFATQLRDQAPRSSPEYAAMSFLLDENNTEEQLFLSVAPEAAALSHLVAGKRHLKAARVNEAIEAFEASLASNGDDWVTSLAQTNLDVARSRYSEDREDEH